MIRDFEAAGDVVKCVTAQVSTSTTDINGTSVNVQAAHSGAVFIAAIGASGDTLSGSVKIELELEHSDDNSTFTDCADADLSAPVDGTNDGCWAVIDDPSEDDVVKVVQYRGEKPYVRPVVNKTGAHTNGIPLSIVGFPLNKRVKT